MLLKNLLSPIWRQPSVQADALLHQRRLRGRNVILVVPNAVVKLIPVPIHSNVGSLLLLLILPYKL